MRGLSIAMKVSSTRRCRSRLLATCAFAMFASPALSQAFADRALQGVETVNSGGVGIVRTPVKDTITVSTPQAIVTWTPDLVPLPPGTINFLPNGREALFQGATLGQDFVILNRVLPSTNRAISFNGTVTSQVVTGFNAATGLSTYGRGGSVWFYSPGGIIAGPTSVFNVGNLILTANDIDATGGLFSGAGAIRFRSAANSVAAVTVQAGAQINLTNAGSYFGVVAPQVTMGGTATVNGSTAYIAAEQVDMTLNGGFFSISFLVGTDVGSALTHTGTTTGPTGTGTIAMAAMPKNTAITMLVGGTVGYTPAATATVQNGTIVLSAGQDLVFASIGQNASTTAANLNIGSGLFRSQVNAQATNIVVTPAGGAPLTFTGNTNLTGLTSASVQVDAGQSMTVGGAFNLVSKLGGTGGAAGITVNGGTLSVAGPTLIDTTAFGINNFAGPGGNGTGGQSRLTVNGGTVTLGDTLTVRADGIGGGGTTISGNGIGGTAAVTLNGGASPTLLNMSGINHQITANGSVNGQFPSISGGNATGGTASLTVNSGTINTPELQVMATAIGGAATTGLAGVASGGTARTVITGGQFNTRTLTLDANEQQGAAGPGGTAGATTGSGLAAVDVSGTGVLAVGATGGNSMTLTANALKAGARFGAPVAGGNLIAGTARITATNGGTITTDATAPSAPKPPVLLSASVIFNDSIPGAPSTSQRAGTVIVNADGGSMSLHRLDMRANALMRDFSIANDPAGPSFGGTATLAARNGGSVTVRTGEGVTPISAYGTGGSTNTPALGTGGTVDVLALGGSIALPDGLSVDTRGYSGTTLGGAGGTINVRSTTGTAAQAGSLTAGVTTLNASGQISGGLPNGTAGAITVANIGAGQTMTFANLFARAGVSGSGAPSGSITLTADNAPIVTTVPFTGIDLGTLGTLTFNAVGAAGTITGSTGVFGYGNDILVNHTGVAPGSTSTITGPTVSLEAGRDQIHTGSVTMRGGTVTLVGRRTLGGVDSAVFATGDLELGSGLNASTNGILFRILDATGRLRGFQGASSYTNEITTPSSFTVGERVYAGIGNIDIRAGTGIDIADAGTSATGQVVLNSTTGDVRLATSGVVLATRPNGITMDALGGTVRFTNLFSRASVIMAGATGVAGGDASAAFGISATSGSGGVTVGNVQATSTTLTAATNIVAGSVFGQTGVTLTATTGSIAATSVAAPGGSIAATGATGVDIADAGASATGQIQLTSTTGDVRLGTSGLPPATRSNGITLNALAGTARFTDLRSAGVITVSGRSGVVGGDANSFTGLQLTSGSGAVVAGALSAPAVVANAATSITLGSAIGGIINLNATSGSVQANSVSGSTTATAATGITIPIVSGSSINLSSPLGAITVATNLAPTSALTVNGRSLFLRSIGSLTTGTLTATGAAGIDVAAGGALTLASVQAVNGPVTLAGATGLTVPTIVSGGTTTLSAVNGAISVATNLQSAGLVTASGRSVFLNGLGALSTNVLTATAGGITVSTGGALTIGTATATGTVTLRSLNAALGFGTVQTSGNAVLSASTTVNGSTVDVGGNADIRAGATAMVQTVRTGGNIDVGAGTGIAVGNAGTGATGRIVLATLAGNATLGTSGTIVAGRPASVSITAPGTIGFTRVEANGPVTMQAGAGILGTSATAATGAMALTTTNGNIAFTDLTAGAGMTLTTPGTITAGNVNTTGGNIVLTGTAGIDINVAAAAASLNASGATIRLGNVGAGQSATFNATGAITLGGISTGTFLEARGSSLVIGPVFAGTDAILSSSGGGLAIGDATAGRDILLTAQSVEAGNLTAPRDLQITTTGLARATGTLAATRALTITAGQTNFQAINGGSVAVTATQGVIFNTITSGSAATLAAGDDAVGTAITATGALTVTAGRNASLGTVQAASIDVGSNQNLFFTSTNSVGATSLRTFGIVNGGNSTAGTTLDVFGGEMTVGNGRAGGALTYQTFLAPGPGNGAIRTGTLDGASVRTVAQGSLSTGLVAATDFIDLAGNTGITTAGATTQTGDIQLRTFLGGPVVSGALRSGRDIDVSNNAGTGVTLTTVDAARNALLASGGTLAFDRVTAAGQIIASATGTITGVSVTGGGQVQVLGRTGVTLDSVISTASDIRLEATSNILRVGALNAAGNIDVIATDFAAAAANVALGTVTSGGNTTLSGNTSSPSTMSGTTIVTGGFLEARGGTLNFGNVTSGTDAILSSFVGPLTVGNVTAGDDVWLSVFNTAPFALTAGTVRSTGLGSDTTASAPATFGDTPGSAGPAGRVIRIRSSGSVLTGAITSPDRLILVADQGALTTGALSAPTGIAVLARGNIALGAVTTSGAFVIDNPSSFTANLVPAYQPSALLGVAAVASGGAVSLTSVAAGSTRVAATGPVGFTTLTATGPATLTSTGGTVAGISLTSTGAVAVSGLTGIDFATLVSGGAAVLTAANGAVRVATDIAPTGGVAATGRSVFLRSSGALNATQLNASAGAIDVSSVGALTIGTATASGAVMLASGGTARFNGAATGTSVTVSSSDIVIAAQGRLGTLGSTTQLTLTNSGTSRTTIGGAGASGYSLSGAEIGRLFGGNITVIAPVIGGPASTAFNSARLPDVTVEAFTFGANTNLGANGTFSVINGGKVRVAGAVGFTGVTDGQAFAIRGDEAVEVLDAGSITLNGASGLSGRLDLTSRNIVASTSAALSDFTTAADLKAISDRAGRNDGAVSDGGYLQAGGIRATLLNSTLIIQNTGTATTNANRDYSGRRGFTVGAGGFTIVQAGDNPVRIAINGRQVGETTPLGAPTIGGFVTGLDMIPLIRIRGIDSQSSDVFQVSASGVLTSQQLALAPRLFDTTSTVNGCEITGASGCRVVPNDPIRDILQGDFGEGSVSNLLPLSLVQLREYVTPGDEPLIDEPVTGAGNDDLWSVDDTKAKCDPAKEKCPA